jgi:hypothetical protein
MPPDGCVAGLSHEKTQFSAGAKKNTAHRALDPKTEFATGGGVEAN